MFSQFQGVQPVELESESRGPDDQASKNTKSPHACVECQKRKVRCDGNQPCRQCLSSRARRRCFYDKHRKRLLPSRKTLEDLSKNLEECCAVLKRLYPTHHVKSLVPLSREELCDLLKQPTLGAIEFPPSPSLNTPHHSSSLEQMPARDSEWDEERRDRDPIPVEADDINALSLPMSSKASYLGASSIKAALMVMLKIQPRLRDALSSPSKRANEPCYADLRQPIVSEEKCPVPWTCKGQAFVDGYFKRLHIFTPMLDEAAFRADYLKGERHDAPWLALLNMVLAMGSIMASTSSDLNHIQYSHKAMEHLPLSAFASSHLETVQALALLGGYYLHYSNRPNMANAIMGATIRMASALGLHRESVMQKTNDNAAADIRRRTWWSIFCLDTWTTTTMGRPSFGRWGPAINIEPPALSPTQVDHDSAQHAGIMPLLESIKFCKIATQIQDILAVSPLLEKDHGDRLDRQLVEWYNGLPWLLQSTEPSTESLGVARCVMRWRYWNLRVLLYRPVLLTLASNKKVALTEDETAAVDLCRELTRSIIQDIANEWTRHQMSGWNAVWFLYQATMIPLISILWQPESLLLPEWQRQIEKALELFHLMKDWSLTARRSGDVVRRIFEASCHFASQHDESLGTFGRSEGDTHISPIEFEMDHVVNMLDQDWLWDVDGRFWEEQAGSLTDDFWVLDTT